LGEGAIKRDMRVLMAPNVHVVTPPFVTYEAPVAMPVTETVTSAVTPPASAETRTLERLIDVLQRELDAARERETMLLQLGQHL
jgi:hypothetical protein